MSKKVKLGWLHQEVINTGGDGDAFWKWLDWGGSASALVSIIAAALSAFFLVARIRVKELGSRRQGVAAEGNAIRR